MEIFLDCGDPAVVQNWLAAGVIDGVTTNPTLLRDGSWTHLVDGVAEIAKVCSEKPVSVEVVAVDPGEVVEQAAFIANLAPNIVVKVPLIGPDGQSYLGAISKLTSQGIHVNCTALMSFGQFALAARAGARYTSLFVGRIEDEGGKAEEVISGCKGWLDTWGLPSRIIAGSLRSPGDFQRAALAGAHVVTVPPSILEKLMDHRYSRATAQQFLTDGRSRYGDDPWGMAASANYGRG
ncbi:transaldolase family protein [Streptomyces sp. NPDC050433]|uniref:transaldolase family protein n=1 Tax=unclassified Streptomyces TaxID=2593676 RepID=UPI003442544C